MSLNLIIRPVPAAVFSLLAKSVGFNKAFSTSNIPPVPGVRGTYLWAICWG